MSKSERSSIPTAVTPSWAAEIARNQLATRLDAAERSIAKANAAERLARAFAADAAEGLTWWRAFRDACTHAATAYAATRGIPLEVRSNREAIFTVSATNSAAFVLAALDADEPGVEITRHHQNRRREMEPFAFAFDGDTLALRTGYDLLDPERAARVTLEPWLRSLDG